MPRFQATFEPGERSTGTRPVLRRWAYVRRLVTAHRELEAVGFKLMYDQVDVHRGLMTCLALRRARIVHLVRSNHLEALLSSKAARARGQYRFHEGESAPDVRLRLDPAKLLHRLEVREREVERWRGRLRRLPFSVLEISYEDLVARRVDVLRNVLSFLGVEAVADRLRSSLIRSSSDGPSDLIENVEHVQGALAGTRFEWMLR